jgi:hypothetical protein
VLKNGYEPSPLKISVQSPTVTVNRAVHFDWASLSAGSSVQSFTPPNYSAFGCGPQGAVDLTDGSGWGSDAPGNGGSGVFGPRQITIRLPRAVNVTTFAVDPSPACGDSTAAAVKAFKIETKTASGSFRVAVNHQTALPIGHFTTLTPAAPASSHVLFVRFTMISNRGDHRFMDMTELSVRGSAA